VEFHHCYRINQFPLLHAVWSRSTIFMKPAGLLRRLLAPQGWASLRPHLAFVNTWEMFTRRNWDIQQGFRLWGIYVKTKSPIFCDTTACSPLKVNLLSASTLVSYSAYCWTLKMEICSSETSVSVIFQKIVLCIRTVLRTSKPTCILIQEFQMWIKSHD
jgi:hypothetical protein